LCFVFSFLFLFFLGLFQYGLWHLGHAFGFSVRGIHVFPHRWHVRVGSGGMSFVSIILIFSHFLLYYHDNILVYKCLCIFLCIALFGFVPMAHLLLLHSLNFYHSLPFDFL